MSDYGDAIREAMTLLANRNAIFVGQAVRYPGTAMYETLKHVPEAQRIEFPVAENMQLGFCTGIALAGGLPVCIYPRINFLLEAISQLVSHLDKLPLYSRYSPKAIIRTAVAAPYPLDPGVQHLGDYRSAIGMMLSTVRMITPIDADEVLPAYSEAIEGEGSYIVVEHMEAY